MLETEARRPSPGQNEFMGRLLVVAGLLVAVAGVTASCSTSASLASLPVCSSGQPGHLVKTPNGETYTTATGPCTPLSTTTTTLASPVALGTTVDLSYNFGGSVTSGRFTVLRVWTGVSPQWVEQPPSNETPAQAVNRYTHGQNVQWIGVDLAITDTSSPQALSDGTIAPGVGGGPGAPVFYFVVNGHGPFTADDNPNTAGLLQAGFAMGVPGCPFPFTSLLHPNEKVNGCVALAVPAGVRVSTVGFDLQPAAGGPVQHVAQWSV